MGFVFVYGRFNQYKPVSLQIKTIVTHPLQYNKLSLLRHACFFVYRS